MAEFDPDAFLKDSGAASFDPDAFLGETPPPPQKTYQQRSHAFRQALRQGDVNLPVEQTVPGPDLSAERLTPEQLGTQWADVAKGLAKGIPAFVSGGLGGDIEQAGRQLTREFGVPQQTYLPTTTEGGYLGPRGLGVMAPAATPQEAAGMSISPMLLPGLKGIPQALRGAEFERAPFPTAPRVSAPTTAAEMAPYEMHPEAPVGVPREGMNARLLPPEVRHTLPPETETIQPRGLGRPGIGAQAAEGPLSQISPSTLTQLRQQLDADGWTPWTIEQRLEEMSPHQTLAEISPNMESRLSGLASYTGESKNTIVGNLGTRAAEAPERIRHLLDDAFGPVKNLATERRALTAQQKAEAGPLYRAFRERAITPTEELVNLLPRLKAAGAFGKARWLAGVEGKPWTQGFADLADVTKTRQLPTAESWDLVKRALDIKIEGSFNQFGEATNTTRVLTGLKNDLISAIDNHPDPYVAGVWKQARGAFAGPAQLKSAHKLGEKILNDSIKPNELPYMIESYSPAERQALAEGMRADFEHRMGRAGPQGRRTLNQILSDNGQSKIRTIIGDEKADALFRGAQHEMDMHDAPVRAYKGSQTSGRETAKQEFAAEKPLYQDVERMTELAGQGVGMVMHPIRTVGNIAGRAVGKSMTARNEAVAQQMRSEMATIYMMQGPERDAVLRWLINTPTDQLPGYRTPTPGQAFAWGGRTKLAHDTVHYLVKSKKDERCGNCSMFVPKARGGPSCTLVKNPIFPTGWCNRYDPQAKRANGGRVDPKNIHTEPSEAQKAAGNYAKDHVRLHGLDITVENAKGSTRRGTDPNGKPWSVKMPAHYGYIKGTVGKDKDHVDVYLGPHKASTTVYVVDQNNAESGRFDEHKAFIGFGSKAQVLRTYRAAFSDGKADQRIGHVREMSIDDFKGWLDSGDTTKRIEHHELKHRAAGGGVQGDDNNDLPVMLEPPRNPARMTPAVENVVGGLAQGAVEPLTDAGYMLGDYLRTQQAPPASDIMAAGTGLGMALIGPKAKGIRAYHGSPYDFDRFDISQIGGGEGAQVYGHGLYFAENEPVALSYKNSPRVTDMDWPVAGTDFRLPAWVARSARTPQGLMEVRQNFVNRLEESKREAEAGNWNARLWVYNQQRIIDALDAVKAGAELKEPGHMYEVNINARPKQFLDWDKPLVQQSQTIQSIPNIADAAKAEAYDRAIASPFQARRDELFDMVKNPLKAPGEFAYNRLAHHNPIAASNVLRDAGVPGIRYLDQFSRNAGKGTRNYVVFDDKLIDILRKYGLAGLSPVAAAELMDQQRAAGGAVRGYQDAGVVPPEDAVTSDPWAEVPRTSYGTPAITVRPPVVSDADLAQQAREAAALRMQQAAVPGARPEGAITHALEGIGEDVYKAAARPSRIWNELQDMPPGQSVSERPDIVDAVAATATDLFTPGMMGAERGAAGIFGGELARTADRAALARAKSMAAKGASREAIWHDTGWFQDHVGNWKFEIPDIGAQLYRTKGADLSQYRVMQAGPMDWRIIGPNNRGLTLPNGNPVTYKSQQEAAAGISEWAQPISPAMLLEHRLAHPELYKAYPELGHLIYRPLETINDPFDRLKGIKGAYFGDERELLMKEALPEAEKRSTILHELGHGVQDIEGWPSGGNLMLPEVQREADAILAARQREAELVQDRLGKERDAWVRQQYPNGPYNASSYQEFWDRHPYRKKIWDEAMNELMFGHQTRRQELFKAYQRIMGEVDARNIQARANMTPEQLRATHPLSTEDVPREQQINVGAQRAAGLQMEMEAPGRVRDPNLWHPISKVKLPRPISEMESVIQPIANPKPERLLDPASLQGADLLPLIGDRSATAGRLMSVAGRRLENPTELQGGAGFKVQNPAAWASGPAPITKLSKDVLASSEKGRPIYGVYTAMGERSIDASHHVSDTLVEMLKHADISKLSKKGFDHEMRVARPGIPAVKDWPGLDAPNLRDWLQQAPMDVRAKFVSIMDKDTYRKKGFPSVAEARLAVTEPRLLNEQTGASGLTIARLDPTGRQFPSSHRTYPINLAGQYVGGLGTSVPKQVMYPTVLRALTRYREQMPGYKPTLDALLLHRPSGLPTVQRADQQWLDNLMRYRQERLKRFGFARGGRTKKAGIAA